MHFLYCTIAAALLNFFSAPVASETYHLNTNDVHDNPPDAFLAGRKTPVWTAKADENGQVIYTKLAEDIVGTAFDSFWAKKNGGSSGAERKRRAAEPEHHSQHHRRRVHRKGHERKSPSYDTIYPSILVITDYSGVRDNANTESNIEDDIIYQMAFWNSVDLHFRGLESPKVRLRLAGIIFGEGRKAQPYMYKFTNGSDTVSSPNGALQEMKKYWGQQAAKNADFNQSAYDVIITLTDVTLGGDEIHHHPLGLSTERGLCMHLSGDRFQAVGIVDDKMKFAGVLTATHELGHLFGAHHDSSDTGECSKNIGFIMAASRSHTNRMHEWSPCSIASFHRFLGKGKECAVEPADYHDPGEPLSRIAPGDVLDADQQCVAFSYLSACEKLEPKMCEKLHCFEDGNDDHRVCKHVFVGAQDGTPCSDNAICVTGVCLEGNEIIDD